MHQSDLTYSAHGFSGHLSHSPHSRPMLRMCVVRCNRQNRKGHLVGIQEMSDSALHIRLQGGHSSHRSQPGCVKHRQHINPSPPIKSMFEAWLVIDIPTASRYGPFVLQSILIGPGNTAMLKHRTRGSTLLGCPCLAHIPRFLNVKWQSPQPPNLLSCISLFVSPLSCG